MFVFQLMYMYAYYIHILYYIHTVDAYLTAICIKVYKIMLNLYIMAFVCFDEYARAATFDY